LDDYYLYQLMFTRGGDQSAYSASPNHQFILSDSVLKLQSYGPGMLPKVKYKHNIELALLY
jgi:hypothetical protein